MRVALALILAFSLAAALVPAACVAFAINTGILVDKRCIHLPTNDERIACSLRNKQ